MPTISNAAFDRLVDHEGCKLKLKRIVRDNEIQYLELHCIDCKIYIVSFTEAK